MDEIKKKAEEIINKVKNDGDFANKFQSNPIEAVEGIVGVDLPDDQINQVVNIVKAKIGIDNAQGFAQKITGLFNK